MTYVWQINDLIDLEYFMRLTFDSDAEDAGSEETAEETAIDDVAFDRQVFLSFPEHEHWQDDSISRRRLLRHWLGKRRERERQAAGRGMVMPGAIFAEAMTLARLLAAGAALLFGVVLTWSLLGYKGQAPVNVFTCLWVLVVPQLVLLVLLGVSVLLVRTGIMKSFDPGYPAVAVIVRSLIEKISRLAGRQIDAGRKNIIRETYGLLGMTKTIYGSVFFWPVFLLAQQAGIFFNLGILGALLLKVAITDLAFGWQTTLQISSESLLKLVEWIALPWSWLFIAPGAHPTPEQIEGSRMILKDGMVHLATGDLVAWWPFILLTVSFYAFLPRLVLAGVGLFFYRRAFQAVGFVHGTCDRLITRMTTPRLKTRGEACPVPEEASVGIGAVRRAGVAELSRPGAMPAVVLVPDELIEYFSQAEIGENLSVFFGLRLMAIIPVEMEPVADTHQLHQLLSDRLGDQREAVRIVVVQEAWRPPIREVVSWIKSIRAAVGPTTGMIIALVGKPRADTMVTMPATVDRKVWEQVVNRLGDAYLRVESLEGNMR